MKIEIRWRYLDSRGAIKYRKAKIEIPTAVDDYGFVRMNEMCKRAEAYIKSYENIPIGKNEFESSRSLMSISDIGEYK